jgi:hypothetical protein
MNCARLSLPLLLLCLAVALPCQAEEPHVFQGRETWDNPDTVTVRGEEFLLDQGYAGGYTSRGFNYNGSLDDGTLFAIHFSQWRYGILNGWAIGFLAVTADGQVYVHEGKLREKSIIMDGSRYSLRFAEGSLTGEGGESRIRLELEGLGCDLWVNGLLPPWKPGDGQAFFPSTRQSFTRLAVPSPWAAVSGWLRLGERRVAASGQCSADRSLHSYPLRDFTNRTFFFRTFSPLSVPPEERWMLYLQVYETHSLHGTLRMPLLLLAHGRDWVFTTPDFTIEPLDAGAGDSLAGPLPRPLGLTAHGAGYELEGNFVVTRLIHTSDVEQKLPVFLRSMAAVFFRRTLLYRLQGYFRGTLHEPQGRRQELLLPGQGSFAVFAE